MSVRKITIGQLFRYTIPGEWGNDGDSETGVPVVRSTNFRNDGRLDFSDVAYRDVPKARLKRRNIQAGDILIEKSGGSPNQPAGRVVYCPEATGGTASNFIEVCKVREQYDSHYVFYLLYTLYQHGLVMKYQQQTTGIINFKLNDYKNEVVAIPESKAEQQHIAEKLAGLEKLIAQTQALIIKHERLRAGLLHDLLTRGVDEHGRLRAEETHKFQDSPVGRIPVEWEVKSLKSVAKLNYGKSPIGLNFGSGIIPVVGTGNEMRFADKFLVSYPSIVLGRKGTLSRPVFLPVPFWPIDTTFYLSRIKDFDIKFLFFALSRIDFPSLNESTGVPSLSRDTLYKVLLPVPGPDEQAAIVKMVDNITELIEQVRLRFTKLQSLKAGLMHDLVNPPADQL